MMSHTESFKISLDNLLWDMRVTKGSRFNAARRLQARDRKSTLLVSITSIYIIFLTIIPLLFEIPQDNSNILSAITLFFSIGILIGSLLQYSNNDPVVAEQHHRRALEVSDLHRRLRSVYDNVDASSLNKFTCKYSRILEKYSNNHSNIDYQRYQVDHRDEFIQNKLNRNYVFYLRFKFMLYDYNEYAFLLIISVMSGLLLGRSIYFA
jgi:hypothetical protein